MEYLSFEFDDVSRLKFFIGFSSLIKEDGVGASSIYIGILIAK